jgi:hypothetical protein
MSRDHSSLLESKFRARFYKKLQTKSKSKPKIAGAALAFILIAAYAAAAKDTKEAPPAPAQITAAKTVFIANAGGEENPSDSQFSGGTDRAYNQFYSELKSWGRYDLAPAPADADLVFELRFTQPRVPSDPQAVLKVDVVYDPQFRLVIRDLKTQAVLWAFTEHAQWAILQGNRDKNFDLAMARLVAEVKNLSARGAPASDDSKSRLRFQLPAAAAALRCFCTLRSI